MRQKFLVLFVFIGFTFVVFTFEQIVFAQRGKLPKLPTKPPAVREAPKLPMITPKFPAESVIIPKYPTTGRTPRLPIPREEAFYFISQAKVDQESAEIYTNILENNIANSNDPFQRAVLDYINNQLLPDFKGELMTNIPAIRAFKVVAPTSAGSEVQMTIINLYLESEEKPFKATVIAMIIGPNGVVRLGEPIDPFILPNAKNIPGEPINPFIFPDSKKIPQDVFPRPIKVDLTNQNLFLEYLPKSQIRELLREISDFIPTEDVADNIDRRNDILKAYFEWGWSKEKILRELSSSRSIVPRYVNEARRLMNERLSGKTLEEMTIEFIQTGVIDSYKLHSLTEEAENILNKFTSEFSPKDMTTARQIFRIDEPSPVVLRGLAAGNVYPRRIRDRVLNYIIRDLEEQNAKNKKSLQPK